MKKENIINIIYNNDQNVEELKIFGSEFVRNNKNKCKIMYENKEYELEEYINIKNNKKEKIEIQLKGINEITNMSCIFHKCNSLSSLTDLSKWDTSNINNMSYLFYECDLLESLPDISKWDISNVKYIHGIFSKCKSLKTLPDISEWDMNDIKIMGGLFSDLSSKIPLSEKEIEEYDKNDKEYIISGMFDDCKSLSSLPDISKWNTSNVTDMSGMFRYCNSLSSLPDISKWNTSNVTDMSYMFDRCNTLSSLPDISKWNTSNVTNMSYMFFNCKKTLIIPSKFK